jgi:hypothetical protein
VKEKPAVFIVFKIKNSKYIFDVNGKKIVQLQRIPAVKERYREKLAVRWGGLFRNKYYFEKNFTTKSVQIFYKSAGYK